MNLIIVESPTKARTLAKFLGKDYLVEATMGHIKDLPKSKLSVEVEKNFEPDYQIVADKKKYIAAIRKAAKKANSVYIATDPDREGEAIAAHVKEVLTARQPLASDHLHRIVFHEITKGAVEKAIARPGKVNDDLVNAQIARRVLDRLVGYKLSPLLWKKIRRGLSAGRVQTVVVRLVVEREREIEAFKKEEYWEIYSEVRDQKPETGEKSFVVKLIRIGRKKAEIEDSKTAKKVVSDLKDSHYEVHEVVRREVKRGPYPPYTTSTLTQASSNVFGWSSKRTMSVAQKLYEEGLITYHRTDSVSIAKSALESARKFIGKKYGNEYLPENPRRFKTKSKSAQEAHEAIRPTSVSTYGGKLSITGRYKADAEKLYGLIWRRFVASQMANAVYDSLRIDVKASPKTKGQSSKEYFLRVTGQTVKFDGWRKVLISKVAAEVDLPNIENGEKLDLVKVDSQQKFTQPPPRYNEASLIKILEKLGIGRPSTYAPTISTVQARQYVEKVEKKFHPTAVGITVNDFLLSNFPGIFSYSFTAGMEGNLDSVANGKLGWQKMVGDFYKPFSDKLKKAEGAGRVKIPTESLGKKCPTCKEGGLVIRTGRFGKFVSCSRFPECKHTEKYIEKIGMKCPDCRKGDVIVKSTKRGRKFYGCSRYPECQWASWKKPETKEENDGPKSKS